MYGEQDPKGVGTNNKERQTQFFSQWSKSEGSHAEHRRLSREKGTLVGSATEADVLRFNPAITLKTGAETLVVFVEYFLSARGG